MTSLGFVRLFFGRKTKDNSSRFNKRLSETKSGGGHEVSLENRDYHAKFNCLSSPSLLFWIVYTEIQSFCLQMQKQRATV